MGRTPFPSPAPESEIHIRVQPRKSVDQSSYLQYQPVSGAGASPSPYPPPGYRNSPNQPPPPPYNPSSSSKRWIPWLVPTIVVVNIILFVIAMSLNNCPQNSGNCLGTKELGRFAFENMHQNPLLGPSPSTILNMGGMDVKMVVQRHEIWRLITCMWLHAGLFHVLANMLSLLFVGIRLEQEFGFLRIGLLYVISGIGGSLVSSLFIRTTISVGASGALFGLLGAMLSELLINWTIYENKVASLLSLIVIILINMAVGILPHVDNFAHLGGFGTGFLLGCVLMIRPQFGYVSKRNVPPGCSPPRKSKYKTYQCSLFFVSILLLVAGFAVGLALLLKGVDGNEHCSWCHYLSCVPTPLWSCQARCTSSQNDNQLFLTCTSNNKSQFYTLDSGGNSTSQLQKLCSELCR